MDIWGGMMRYPIAIEPGNETTAFGVVVPDLPGCFSAGDSLEEAILAAEEAVAGWIDAVLDAGGTIPTPSSLDVLLANPDFAGWTFGVIKVDAPIPDGRLQRALDILSRAGSDDPPAPDDRLDAPDD